MRAVSVGGFETCIELPGWKLCFDIGRCPPTATRWPTVLVTHAHSDHLGGIVHHCASRDMLGLKAPTYVLPRENEDAFTAMWEAWRRLDRSDLPHRVVAVSPGDVVPLGPTTRARVFRAVHRVPSVGYALCRFQHRLKAEWVGRPRAELIAAREAGEAIQDEVETVEVAFCGDTTIDVFDREPLVRAARLLILEVTFLDDRVSVENARSKGHVHLDEVVERADRFENEAVLLTHRSLRYGNADAERIVRARLPEPLSRRVTLLRAEPPWEFSGER